MLRLLTIILLLIMAIANSFAALEQQKIQQNYCPEPQTLVKLGLYWHSGDIWKDYSQSFVNSIKEFYGVQWVGVNVGSIICLYEGRRKLAFKVALQTIHPLLVKMPSGDNWTKIKQGYMQCLSDDVKDCPFEIAKLAPTSDMYSQIRYRHHKSS